MAQLVERGPHDRAPEAAHDVGPRYAEDCKFFDGLLFVSPLYAAALVVGLYLSGLRIDALLALVGVLLLALWAFCYRHFANSANPRWPGAYNPTVPSDWR